MSGTAFIEPADIAHELRKAAANLLRLADWLPKPKELVADQPSDSPAFWPIMGNDIRVRKALIRCASRNRMRLETIHDVAAFTEQQLLEVEGCGAGTLNKIKKSLWGHGLELSLVAWDEKRAE